jgi:hypothetical protein
LSGGERGKAAAESYCGEYVGFVSEKSIVFVAYLSMKDIEHQGVGAHWILEQSTVAS